MRIINVTAPTAPWVTATFATPSGVVDIQLASGRAYLCTTGSGLLIEDVSNPLAPSGAGSFQVVPSAVCSAVAGNSLFLALGDPMRGFKTLDVSLPRLVFSQAAQGSNLLVNLAVSDRYAYATDYLGFDIYDISGGLALRSTVSPQGGAGGVDLSGNLLITGCTSLSVYDISNPTAPALLSSLPVPNYVMDVRIRGSLVYVACRDFGLKIIDISTPSSPKELGSLALAVQSTSLATIGNYVLVAHARNGLAVVDVTDPLAPRLAKDVTVPYYGPGGSSNSGNWIDISGNFAYLAEGSGGLVIYDVSSPTSPVEKGHCAPTSTMQDYSSVTIQGEYAFVSRQSKGISLINVSDPNSPVVVSTLGSVVSPQEDPRQVVVFGRSVFTVSPGGTVYPGIIRYVTE